MNLNEIIEVVDGLNEKLGQSYDLFKMDYSPWVQSISVQIGNMEIMLWDSEIDDRKYNEEADIYEPLESYCIKEMERNSARLIELINKIKEQGDEQD